MAVGAGISAAPVRAVEQAATPFKGLLAGGVRGEQQVHQVGAAVDNRGIHHLPDACAARVQYPARMPIARYSAPPPRSPINVGGGSGGFPGSPANHSAPESAM